jgi:hypothetical protein
MGKCKNRKTGKGRSGLEVRKPRQNFDEDAKKKRKEVHNRRKNAINITFDAASRHEYMTGFRKSKDVYRILFDAASRHEYMTGFRKSKKLKYIFYVCEARVYDWVTVQEE